MSNERKLTARVRVKVTLEVTAQGTYGGDWKLADMLEQAEREGLQRLENICQRSRGELRLIGKLQTEVVMFPEKLHD